MIWSRAADRTWERRLVRGLDQQLDMPELGVRLALLALYDGVEFPPRPRLVPDEREPTP